MASFISSGYTQDGNDRGQKDKDELLVFGYECKLFRDGEKAAWIDSKQHLVPWNGNKNLMIDRCFTFAFFFFPFWIFFKEI